MPVSVLLESLPERRLIGEPPAVVRGLTADSRRVEAGDCFVAVPGFKQDARRFVPDAVARGARLVVTEGDALGGLSVAQVLVPSARQALARLAGAFYGHPSRRAHAGGDHRNQRQDHDVVPGGRAPARAGAAHGHHRHDPVRGRRRDPRGQSDDAGGAGARGDAGRDARRRRRRRGDGGVLARPGALASGRAAVRRGRVHQPHPGPPRLPRLARGIPAGPSGDCSSCSPPRPSPGAPRS